MILEDKLVWACCPAPMLLVTGALSIGATFITGVAGALVVVLVALVVFHHRVGAVETGTRAVGAPRPGT